MKGFFFIGFMNMFIPSSRMCLLEDCLEILWWKPLYSLLGCISKTTKTLIRVPESN